MGQGVFADFSSGGGRTRVKESQGLQSTPRFTSFLFGFIIYRRKRLLAYRYPDAKAIDVDTCTRLSAFYIRDRSEKRGYRFTLSLIRD
jgi:hypothetical protein